MCKKNRQTKPTLNTLSITSIWTTKNAIKTQQNRISVTLSLWTWRKIEPQAHTAHMRTRSHLNRNINVSTVDMFDRASCKFSAHLRNIVPSIDDGDVDDKWPLFLVNRDNVPLYHFSIDIIPAATHMRRLLFQNYLPILWSPEIQEWLKPTKFHSFSRIEFLIRNSKLRVDGFFSWILVSFISFAVLLQRAPAVSP